jgi:hypothetical protein
MLGLSAHFTGLVERSRARQAVRRCTHSRRPLHWDARLFNLKTDCLKFLPATCCCAQPGALVRFQQANSFQGSAQIMD